MGRTASHRIADIAPGALHWDVAEIAGESARGREVPVPVDVRRALEWLPERGRLDVVFELAEPGRVIGHDGAALMESLGRRMQNHPALDEAARLALSQGRFAEDRLALTPPVIWHLLAGAGPPGRIAVLARRGKLELWSFAHAQRQIAEAQELLGEIGLDPGRRPRLAAG